MSKPIFTRPAYEQIVNLAWSTILDGVGIVPSPDQQDLPDTITKVAEDFFDGKAAAAAFDQSIAGLDFDTREAICRATWALVIVHQDGGYTLGCAVGLQLAGRSVPAPSSKQAVRS
jgi:hypothetical protein